MFSFREYYVEQENQHRIKKEQVENELMDIRYDEESISVSVQLDSTINYLPIYSLIKADKGDELLQYISGITNTQEDAMFILSNSLPLNCSHTERKRAIKSMNVISARMNPTASSNVKNDTRTDVNRWRGYGNDPENGNFKGL